MHNGYKLNLYDDDDSNYEPNDARWNKGTIIITIIITTTNTDSKNNYECYE